MEKGMFALAEELKFLRDHKSALEDEVKVTNGKIENVTADLTAAMVENETPSFTHKQFQFSLSTRMFASANKDNKDELYEALRENGYGDLVYETVNANSLSSFVKERMEEFSEANDGEDGLPPWLEGKVNVYDKISVKVAKAARK